jgi:hypothetical protein
MIIEKLFKEKANNETKLMKKIKDLKNHNKKLHNEICSDQK